MVSQSFDEEYKNDNQPFVIMIDSKEYEVFITYVRVNKDTLPDGWYAYDLREEDGEICELKDGYILVDYYGTFCTPNVIPFTDDEKSLFIDKDTQDFEYSFM